MENIPDDVSEEVSEKKVMDLSANLISSTSHSIKGMRRREEIDNPKRGTVNKTSNNKCQKQVLNCLHRRPSYNTLGQALFGGRGAGGKECMHVKL